MHCVEQFVQQDEPMGGVGVNKIKIQWVLVETEFFNVSVKARLHLPLQCLSPCPSLSKFIIVLMVTDHLIDILGFVPILFVKQSVTINILVKTCLFTPSVTT